MEKISGMGKETSEISDHIKLHIENGKILSLKTHRVSKSVEEHIKEAVGLILDRLTYPTLVPTLYTIIKELAINACKANQKRVFFEERGYSMLNPSEYAKGVREYREMFSEEMSNEFGIKAKKKGYYCLINFKYNDDGIIIEVINNTPIAKEEEKSIRERLEKGMMYDDIAQFYIDNADTSEGAGLGLALILIMLKGEGIDPNFFRIIIGEDSTIARLEIPLSEKFISQTDETVTIAKSFGVKVYNRPFENYADQKNFAISKTKHDWVLAIDADEVVSPNLKTEILDLFSKNQLETKGYLIPRLTFYLGKWIRFSGYYPNYQIRLFHKSEGQFSGGLVHERVKLSSKPHKLKNPLFHYSYKNISDHLKFIDRYSSLFAEEEYRKGKRSSVLWAFVKGCFKGFYMYWIRLGILDGKQGFVLALLGFYYNFLKYLKLYEKSNSVPSFFVMVDSIHDVKGKKSTKKNSDQIHV